MIKISKHKTHNFKIKFNLNQFCNRSLTHEIGTDEKEHDALFIEYNSFIYFCVYQNKKKKNTFLGCSSHFYKPLPSKFEHTDHSRVNLLSVYSRRIGFCLFRTKQEHVPHYPCHKMRNAWTKTTVRRPTFTCPTVLAKYQFQYPFVQSTLLITQYPTTYDFEIHQSHKAKNLLLTFTLSRYQYHTFIHNVRHPK